MRTNEYLNAAKEKMGGISDYELAKRLEITRGFIALIRSGQRGIPNHAAFKLAIALELDPAQVLADIESQHEKNPQRKAFWTGFLSRAAKLLIVGTLALIFTGIYGSGQERSFGGGARPFRRRVRFA
jgi:hypothetical protein